MKPDGAVRSLGAVLFHLSFLTLTSGVAAERPHLDTQDEGDAAGGVAAPSVHMDTVCGLVSCVLALLLYGTNYVPVKKVETGDGMFFQWVSCAAIWVVALIGDVLLRSSKAHPAAMLGGMIWATGNISSVPVVKCVGLGLGMLLWGSSCLLIGWASSRFGLFGLEPEVVSRPILNYAGAALCLLRGHSLTVCIPVARGWTQYHQKPEDHYLDYCFAQSSGIFLMSTVYFVLYCAVMKNRPRVYPRAILPGFLTGVMCGVGTFFWLTANRHLGPVVTFPIVTAGYGVVAALWGSVVFKEVKGLGNGLLFALATCIILTGSLLTVVSKI